MNNETPSETHTSLELSKKLKEGGFEKAFSVYYGLWDSRPKTRGWKLMGFDECCDDFRKMDYAAYDILNDLYVRYAKEMFGKDDIELSECHFCPNGTKSHDVFELMQQRKKQEAEDYIWENCLFNPKNKK